MQGRLDALLMSSTVYFTSISEIESDWCPGTLVQSSQVLLQLDVAAHVVGRVKIQIYPLAHRVPIRVSANSDVVSLYIIYHVRRQFLAWLINAKFNAD